MKGMRLLLLGMAVGWLRDPCLEVAREGIVKMEAALKCYDNFYLQEGFQAQTLRWLRKGLPLYGLVNEKKRSPERRLPSAVDLDAELSKLEQVSFALEWKFHHQVKEVFEKARDPNLFYNAGCFSSFTFHVPFPLVVQVEGGRTVVRVAYEISHSELLIQKWRQVGIDVLSYAGREVVEIEMVPALEYLESFAGANGGYFFNAALSRQVFRDGSWQFIVGNFAERKSPPSQSSIEFTLTGNEIVNGHILVSVPSGFMDSYSFYRHLCLPRPFDLELPIIEALPSAKPSLLPEDKVEELFGSIGVFQSNINAALIISSFDNSNKWRKDLVEALEYLSQQRIENVILDLRSSTGDDICGSYALLDYLFPDLPKKRFPIIFSPAVESFTEPFFLNYNRTCQFSIPTPKRTTPYKLKILTDGVCTKACSILVHGLIELSAIPTYILGNLEHKPSDHAGAIPYNLKLLEPPLTDANLFFSLGQTSTSRNNEPRPLDYMFRLARHHLDYPLHPTLLYNKILNTNLSFIQVNP
ncbi:hypothetical protein DSO57_1009318 [Entomophthora muscae]|uniref:Uncharacterized protein n=1 Tax=Entomophthora muscae TaxID=34485 RepID=A0ACC2RLN7_9FUNG|nr:hypothetical protein DSO57_1009318 [Entomophthora muscae]